MRERTGPEEEELLRAAVEFANLAKIRSTRQVENLFMRTRLAARPFKVLPRKEFTAYYGDQAKLRFWLDQIAELGEAARPVIGRDVSKWLGTVEIRVAYDPTQGRLGALMALNGVQACYSYATALLLDRGRGLTQRLGKCGWCGRYNLTVRGKPKMHCSEAHRRKADAKRAGERMKALRQARKRQRGEQK